MRKQFKVGAAVSLAVLAGAAQAAVVTYGEASGGDLGDRGDPLTTFTSGIGVNTVSGNTSVDLNVGAEFDSFAFIVPVGMEVASVKVSLTDVDPDMIKVDWACGQVLSVGSRERSWKRSARSHRPPPCLRRPAWVRAATTCLQLG